MKHGILGLVLAAAGALGAVAATPPTRIETGLIAGLTQPGLTVFEGVPFAAPPVGPLRWRPPQPARPWPGVREADRFAPECPQRGAYPEDSPPEAMSEDCLYLDIWAPAGPRRAKRPVMVWIHGGGLTNGSASSPLYAGDRLARRGVVVVSVGYRLGALGFLANPDLTREAPDHVSGNYGLLDQIAALAWVRRNIAAFGGDPGDVTVFGQSSGSISISALIASPLARGLFERAIGESGGLFEPLALAPQYQLAGAEREGSAFAERLGAGTLRDLRAAPVARILADGYVAHPVVDGRVLKEAPFDAYRGGRQNPVDLLLGYNAREGAYFLKGRTITAADLDDQLGRDFPGAIVARLGPGRAATDGEARAAFVRFEGDLRFRWDMWTWARLQAGAGGRAFLYEFSRAAPTSAEPGLQDLGAAHGAEMPYVFGHPDRRAGAWTDADRRLSDAMIGYWTNFARTGNPNGPGLPDWPAFDASGAKALRLDAPIAAIAVPRVSDLEAIDRLYAGVR